MTPDGARGMGGGGNGGGGKGGGFDGGLGVCLGEKISFSKK